jgi:hypothetical protein
METDREIIIMKKKRKNRKNRKGIKKSNIILYLLILNLFLMLPIFFYQIKKIVFFNKPKQQKTEEPKQQKIEKTPKINTNTTLEKIKYLKILTNNNENEYKGIQECLLNDPDQKFCIYHLILPKEVVGKKRILLGEKSDGCYVLLDDFENIKYAYSFGISTNIQFDKALADRGIDVFMYDHTINSLPYYNPKFHWKKIGLCGIGKQYRNMKNLEELIAENGHINEKNMILKMDIEHWEFESIIDLKEDTLNQFKYILVEYHFKDENEFKSDNLYYNVLKKISKTHQSYYARCNGDRGHIVRFGINRICFIIEVCYIIKKDNIFKKDETVYPIYEFDISVPQKGKLEMNLNILKLFED